MLFKNDSAFESILDLGIMGLLVWGGRKAGINTANQQHFQMQQQQQIEDLQRQIEELKNKP